MVKKVLRSTYHLITGNRRFYYRELTKASLASEGKVVLELGSGIEVDGKYPYSATHLFPNCKEFIMSDLNPSFGHQVIDVTTMKHSEKFDIILCLNVLEHVYDFQIAVNNMHKALKRHGELYIGVPFTFPLHDEPHDYWRFTEHALGKILKDFSKVEVKHQRARIFPTGYFVIARK